MDRVVCLCGIVIMQEGSESSGLPRPGWWDAPGAPKGSGETLAGAQRAAQHHDGEEEDVMAVGSRGGSCSNEGGRTSWLRRYRMRDVIAGRTDSDESAHVQGRNRLDKEGDTVGSSRAGLLVRERFDEREGVVWAASGEGICVGEQLRVAHDGYNPQIPSSAWLCVFLERVPLSVAAAAEGGEHMVRVQVSRVYTRSPV